MNQANQQHTREEHRAFAKKLAEEAFAEHVLVDHGKYFMCGKPGTSSYHFMVTFLPTYVILVGDIGELVLQCSDHDSKQWALSSASMDYVLGKCRNPEHTFLVKEALAWLDEAIEEHRTEYQQCIYEGCEGDAVAGFVYCEECKAREDQCADEAKQPRYGQREDSIYLAVKEEFQERMEYESDLERAWYEAWEECRLSPAEAPRSRDFSAERLLQFHALQKLVELYRATQVK